MSKSLKILSVLVGILLLLVIVLMILVKLIITPEKVRETLLPIVEKQMQRQVELGEVEIGLFSGVELKDLVVKQKDGSGDFVSVGTLELDYQFLPLLSGKVLIERLIFDRLNVVVVRHKDGSFNFSDLLKDQNAKPAAEPAPAADGGGKPLDLLVSAVDFNAGELTFIDEMIDPQKPFRFQVNDLNIEARQISFERAFPIELSARLNQSELKLQGQYDLSKQGGNLSLSLAPFELTALAPYYADALPGQLDSAPLALDLKATLEPQKVTADGELTLAGLNLRLDAMPEAAIQDGRLNVDFSLQQDLEKQTLNLNPLQLDYNGIKLRLNGDVQLAGDQPRLALKLRVDPLDLQALVDGLPAGLTAAVRDLGVSGRLQVDGELAGSVSAGPAVLKKAQIVLQQVKADAGGLSAGIDGKIDYVGEAVSAEKLQLTIGGEPADFSFRVADVLGKVPNGQFQLVADTLDLNKIIPGKTAEKTSPPSDKAPSASTGEGGQTVAEELGPFDIPLRMKGEMRVASMLYKQLQIHAVQADLLLQDNHLKIERLRGEVAGGEIKMSGDINLAVKGLSYEGQLDITQSKLAGIIAGILPDAGESVSGLLQWRNQFSGSGTDPKKLLKALQLDGALEVEKGKVAGSPLLEQLAGFLGDPDLKVLSFDGFKGTYELNNGQMQLSGALDSSKAKLVPQGTIGVDGSLNLSLDARLAPELLAKAGGGGLMQKALTDEKGWSRLPLKIKGTYKKPEIGLDDQLLKQQAADRAKQEVQKRLLEKISPEGDTSKEPARQLLDQGLKKLFGN